MSATSPRRVGILAALPDELQPVVRRLRLRRRLDIATGQFAGHDILAVVGGVGPEAAERGTRRLIEAGCEVLLSIGFAGGLDPSLRVADVVTLNAVVTPADVTHTTRPAARLRGVRGVTLGAPLGSVAAKGALHAATGAAVVDMETAALADLADHHQVPWIGLRAVSDTAADELPAVVVRNIRPDLGRVLVAPLVARAVIDPRLWWPLLRLAVRSTRAGQALAEAVAATLEALP
jgi:adenosylhomocysteine nucleosidase